jgi:uncharacterized membrane protein YphA (DoxX/SURF4 family)
MFYRVDYNLAVMLAGFVVGALFSRRTAGIDSSRLAGACYAAVAILVVLRTCAFTGVLIASHTQPFNTAGGLTGDLLGFLFGAFFGLALRRGGGGAFLRSSTLLRALCLMLAFNFAMAGIGKAFSMGPMTEFFTQSGYSVAFLRFIDIAEVVGALGLLVPWGVPFALAGLTVDMFGAVLTHVHNGDPLNDSSGAIAQLIRLAAVGVLWAMRPREDGSSRKVRTAVVWVAASLMICCLLAEGGSVAIRHWSPPASAAPVATSK